MRNEREATEEGIAEAIWDACDCQTQRGKELNSFVVGESESVVFAVSCSFGCCWEIETVFAVKATRAFGDASIELLEVVGTPNHHDAIIVFQPVNFVQEEAPSVFCDDTFKIIEDGETGRHSAGFFEDLADAVDISVLASCRLDVECGHICAR